jgi:hypothetical protein
LRYGFLHNVITIDGIDPNTGWDRHYGFDLLENRWVTNSTYDFLEGTYEYRNNLLDAMWRRSVFYVKGEYWIVLDAIYGDGEHRVESNLQFMIGNEVEVGADRVTATAPNGATLDIVNVLGNELEPAVVIGDTEFPGSTFLTQYPGFVDWIPGGRGWVGMFGNESSLDAVRTYPAPALLKSGTVELPFKSAMILTPSIDKVSRSATARIIDESSDSFTIEVITDSSFVDRFTWKPAAWRDRSEKISDDSGWWARSNDDGVSRIIVTNADSVVIESDLEKIQLTFDAPFEGQLHRTDDGWMITPDDYNAVPPVLLSFTVTTDGKVESYRTRTSDHLLPNIQHALILE